MWTVASTQWAARPIAPFCRSLPLCERHVEFSLQPCLVPVNAVRIIHDHLR